jgi:hypothetical protein
LKLSDSILKDTREALGLSISDSSFNKEIIPHINSAISKLHQNGIGKYLIVDGEAQTWGDLQDPTQLAGNLYFASVPLFINLSTKILFDPPPPSSVEYHQQNVSETLWRLKVAYEYYEPIV